MAQDYSIPTGSDILSYTGNAGLAAGAGTGLMPFQVNPLAGVDSALDKIQTTNQQKALIDYRQKQQNQEDLAKMLAETGGSVFNMKNASGQNVSFTPLPQDQQVLTQKAHDLRHMILENPDNYQFNEDYLDKRKEFDNLTNHAGIRAMAHSAFNQDAAKTNDLDERNNIAAIRKNEIDNHNLDEYHMPEPYLPKLTSDPEKFISSKDAQNEKNKSSYNVGSDKDANGNLIYKSMDGLNDNTLDFRGKIYPGSPAFPDAVNYTRDYLQRIATDPSAVIQHNNNVDAINRARGYVNADGVPVNQHYIPHIADVVTDPATGQPKVVVKNTNPADVAYSLMGEEYGSLQESKEIKKSAQDIAKEDIGITNIKNEMQRRNAETAKGIADSAEKKREFDNPHEKSTPAAIKEQQDRQAAVSAYQQVHKVFDDGFSGKQPVAKAYPSFWNKYGINPSEYNFYPDITQKAADAFVGVPHPLETTTSVGENNDKTVKKNQSPSLIPDKVVPIEDKKTGERKLVYIKDNEIVSIADEKTAVANKLKHEAGYEPKIYEGQTAEVNKVYGGTPAPPQQTAGTPAQASQSTSSASIQSFIPKYSGAQVATKMDNGVPKALVNGKWKKIIGKDSKTGEIKTE